MSKPGLQKHLFINSTSCEPHLPPLLVVVSFSFSFPCTKGGDSDRDNDSDNKMVHMNKVRVLVRVLVLVLVIAEPTTLFQMADSSELKSELKIMSKLTQDG